MSGGGYPKFKNDRGVPEICFGVKEFMCIGESPPQDHPHVYINMGDPPSAHRTRVIQNPVADVGHNPAVEMPTRMC